NIGDPVAKGEPIPRWLKDIVAGLATEDATYGYSPTKGIRATREFLATRTNARGGMQITAEDIIFFNGLGDAVQKIYGQLNRAARVLIPSPTYTAHSTGEAFHAGTASLTYRLDPGNHWYPDVAQVERLVEGHPEISALLIINPDNPTGAVFPEAILRQLIDIARKHDLFVICDEVYHQLTYHGQTTRPLSDLIGDVPALALKGVSKEVPWPGARCGWIEVYNADKDAVFARYVRGILDAKMVEVCSTTLPQRAIPAILSHPEFPNHIAARNAHYERSSQIAYDVLREVPGLTVNRTHGAFYMSVVIDTARLHARQTLPIASPEVRTLVEGLVSAPGVALDKRFVYYLLASTGICVVPLSSFGTTLNGFRITLLEPNEAELRRIFTTIAQSVTAYLASHKS
ncbi:MAG: pyridoxal phosphate-dependent aminotransferase, partial [Myxococcota bacterium]